MVDENRILLKIKDLDVDFEVTKINFDSYEVRVFVCYNFLIAYQKNIFRIVLDKIALKSIISNLVNGQKSSCGKSNI